MAKLVTVKKWLENNNIEHKYIMAENIYDKGIMCYEIVVKGIEHCEKIRVFPFGRDIMIIGDLQTKYLPTQKKVIEHLEKLIKGEDVKTIFEHHRDGVELVAMLSLKLDENDNQKIWDRVSKFLFDNEKYRRAKNAN